VLDPFKPYLNERLAQGERNATLLLTEITGQGYTGGYNTLARYLRPLRRLDAATLADLPPRPAPPAVRKVTGWITGLPGNLEPDDSGRLHAIRARCPELDAAVRHVAGFARMIKDLSGDQNTLTRRGRRRPTAAAVVHRGAAPRPGRCGRRAHPAIQLRCRRRHRQPHQAAQDGDVRTRETRPPAQADTPGLSTAPDSETTRPPP